MNVFFCMLSSLTITMLPTPARVYRGVAEILETAGVSWQDNLPVMMDFEVQITLHYSNLHYTTLHYTTLHYTTLHSTTLSCEILN